MTTHRILITPAPDCPLAEATPPPIRTRLSRANVEYDLLTAAPYRMDHARFTHAVHCAMARASGRAPLDFAQFHAKGQPCMRASPLTKRYGWAAHYDAEGRLALIDPASATCAALLADPALPKTRALRSKRPPS